MHITTRNVNTAFRTLVEGIYTGDIPTVKRESRNGGVLQIPEPIILTYTHPRERVLFNTARDCNSAFHVYEALWMLAGRNDVAPLSYFASNMANYSDDGKTLNGAYGYRWRKHWGYDQLDWIVDALKANPDDRRQVLQMWDAGCINEFSDGVEGTGDLYIGGHGGKDVPCNVCALFLIRGNSLDLTVYNRSNDLIWGALGANAVHFSFLQEYIAARIGVEVGVYNQVSNNMHVYLSNWKPEEWMAENLVDRYGYGTTWKNASKKGVDTNSITPDKMVPLVRDPVKFDAEVQLFVEHHKEIANTMENQLTEPFLKDVANPMMLAFHWYKMAKTGERPVGQCYLDALTCLQKCKDDAWRIAATNWIKKRRDKTL